MSGSSEYINICPTCYQPWPDIKIIEESKNESIVLYRIFYKALDVGWIREVYTCFEGRKYNREFYMMIYDESKRRSVTNFLLDYWLPKENIIGYRSFYDLKVVNKSNTRSDC